MLTTCTVLLCSLHELPVNTRRQPKPRTGGLLRLRTTETSHRPLVATAFACISPTPPALSRTGGAGGGGADVARRARRCCRGRRARPELTGSMICMCIYIYIYIYIYTYIYTYIHIYVYIYIYIYMYMYILPHLTSAPA